MGLFLGLSLFSIVEIAERRLKKISKKDSAERQHASICNMNSVEAGEQMALQEDEKMV